jgi:L-seryl-tRNA(Ser) seleniumtransferase
MSSLLSGFATKLGAARKTTTVTQSIYAELGVRPFINGRGVATFYSSTLMPPEVHRAMERASEHFVEIVELQRAVGARLAAYADAEAAMVCSGSAACIAQGTAGCIAGMDPEKIWRLPDSAGMKSQVIVTRRSVWDRGIRMVGGQVVVVTSLAELQDAISDKTAMMEYAYGENGPVKLEEAMAICKKRNVPFFLDAAATCPPFERLKTIGALMPDLFCVSGGKGLFGPQCSGILFGRKDLVEAALRNGSPYEGAVCRPMKVGKEEIVGVLAAVEWSSKRDYKADCQVWESRMQHIANALSTVTGVQTEVYYRKVGNEVPHVAIRWDEHALALTKQQVIDALRNGEPRIEVIGESTREYVKVEATPPSRESNSSSEPARLISIVSNTLKQGEEKIIAQRLKEIFKPGSDRARPA